MHLKFYASLRLDVRKIASLKKNEKHFGNRIAVKVVKNKMAPPFKKVELDLLFSEGISKELDLLDAALAFGVIEQAGAWFSYKEQKFAQGREQVLTHLKENKPFMLDVTQNVMQAIRNADSPVPPILEQQAVSEEL